MFDATLKQADEAHRSLQFGEALKYYNKALEYQPRNAYARGQRGNVKLALGDPKGALTDFDIAISENPRDAYALRGRGAAKQEVSQDHESSLRDFEASLAIEPNNAFALHNCAELERRLERFPKALEHINAALRITPLEPVFLKIRGIIYYNLARYDDALGDFDTSLQKDSQQAETLYWRGRTIYNLGDHQRAVTDFANSLAINEDADTRKLYDAIKQNTRLSQRQQVQQQKHDEFDRQFSTIQHDLKNNRNLHTLEVRYQTLEKDALQLKHSGFFESRGDFHFQRAKKMHSSAAQRKPYSDALANYTMASKFNPENTVLNKKLFDAKEKFKAAAALCREDLTLEGIDALEKAKKEIRKKRDMGLQAPRELELTDLSPDQRATLDQMLAQMRQQSSAVSHSPPPPAVPARTYRGSAAAAAATTKAPPPTFRTGPPAGTPACAPASTSRTALLSTPYAKLPTASGKTVTVWHATPSKPATSLKLPEKFEEAMENFRNNNFGSAIANFKYAGMDNPEVQYHIGLCHEELSKKDATLKTTNIKEAIRWLEKAAKQDHSLASAKLANLRSTYPELV